MPTPRFGTLDPERQREISSKGGTRANALGVTHRWNSDQAKEAARRAGANRTARALGLPLPYQPNRRSRITPSKRNVA